MADETNVTRAADGPSPAPGGPAAHGAPADDRPRVGVPGVVWGYAASGSAVAVLAVALPRHFLRDPAEVEAWSMLAGLVFVAVTSLVFAAALGRRGAPAAAAPPGAQPGPEPELLRSAFEGAQEGIMILDQASGIIVECSPSLARRAGYERAELVGKPQSLLFPAASRFLEGRTAAWLVLGNRSGATSVSLTTRSGARTDVEAVAGSFECGGRRLTQVHMRDVSTELLRERERATTLVVMRLLSRHRTSRELVSDVLGPLLEWSGCAAVAVRLREGGDFPLIEAKGFPPAFLATERSVAQVGPDGRPATDAAGKADLACACGDVLRGRFDPSRPYFTARGSFWSNGTTALLARPRDAERFQRMRGCCNGLGYESVALVALRCGREALGLLHLADPAPGRFTPEVLTFLESLADQLATVLLERRASEALRGVEARARPATKGTPPPATAAGRAPTSPGLPERARRLEEFVEATAAGTWEWNVPTGAMTWDARWSAILGFPRGEPAPANAQAWCGLVHPADATAFEEALSRCLKGELPAFDCVYRARPRDGSWVWVHDVGAVVERAADGSPVRVVGTRADVTALKRAEEDEVRAAREQAERAGRARQLPEAPLPAPETAAPDLNHAIGRAINMLRRILGPDVELAFLPGHALWPVGLAPALLEQLLTNVAVAARDAMGGAGALTLATENATVPPAEASRAAAGAIPAAPAGVPPGDYVVLTASDTGAAAAPPLLPRAQGTGQAPGLATVYGLAEQHRGAVTVVDHPGGGTTLAVFLPRGVLPEAEAEGDGARTGGS